MNIVKWAPLREMTNYHNSFDRFFDSPLLRRSPWFGESGDGTWNPAVDIYETGDKVVFTAELPGMKKEDISIDFKEGVLTLSGERTYENEVKEDSYYRKERSTGKFYRAFRLNEKFDPEKIEADLKDGVLKINVPKPEENKPKKISVH